MKELSGSTVFVTGAGGFLGRHVISALSCAGARVRAFVGPEGQIPEMPKTYTQDLFHGDICSPETWERGLAGADVVVHLAGMPSVTRSFAEPEEYVRVHVCGTAVLLKAIQKSKIDQFVYVSSAEVYGCPQTNPVPEEHPLEPRSPYAAAKIGAEKLIEAWHHSFGQPSIVLRPFSIYGPGASEHSLLSQLLAQLQTKCDLEVYDPLPVRDYCFVEDFVRAVVLCCASPIRFGVFNIGTMTGLSVHQVAMALLTALGRSGQVRTRNAGGRPTDIFSLVADNRKALAGLAWQPRIGFEEGLRKWLDSRPICVS